MRMDGCRSCAGPGLLPNRQRPPKRKPMFRLLTSSLEGMFLFALTPRAGADAAAPRRRTGLDMSSTERLKILIVTDAWSPQVNGVVRTLEMLGRELKALGHRVRYVTPEKQTTLPLPTYPEIRLALFPRQ